MITKIAEKPTSVTDPQIVNRPIFNWPFTHLSFVTGGEKYTAMFTYTAQYEDELSFEAGETVTVLNKDEADWWKGECNGKTGVFPSNYVEPLKCESFMNWTFWIGTGAQRVFIFFKKKNTFETPYCILHTITYLLFHLFCTSSFLQLWFVFF